MLAFAGHGPCKGGNSRPRLNAAYGNPARWRLQTLLHTITFLRSPIWPGIGEGTWLLPPTGLLRKVECETLPARGSPFPPTPCTGPSGGNPIITCVLVSDFNYLLPQEHIAQEPLAERAASRL